MKHDKTCSTTMIAGLLVLSVSLGVSGETVNDAGTVVGFRGKVEVDVAEGQTRVETHPVVQEAESKLMKTGKGTWRLPIGAFRQSEAIDVGVRDGTLELTAETLDDGVSKPTAILSKASLWISTKDDNGAMSAKLALTDRKSVV